MRICYIPTYENDYSRIKIIRDGLRKNGVEIIDCSSHYKNTILRYIHVFIKFLKNKSKSDMVFLAFFGQPLVPLVKLFTKKRIVLDAFMSAYNTYVQDKRIIRPNTIKSRILYWLDRLACEKADLILLDTEKHIEYFCKTFRVKKKKFKKVLVGADNSIYYPLKSGKNKTFTAVFPGRFIPLQGVPYIVKAAKHLEKEDINLQIIGNGQLKNDMLRLAEELKLKNIEFIDFMPEKELPKWMTQADVGLGIFGDTQKAGMVIPNKAYQFLAMAKPLVTADTPAMQELLKDNENVILCPPANPKALAEAIIMLKNDKELRDNISKCGYKLYQDKCTPEMIGKELKEELRRLL